jgi:hypothetical protein
MLSSFFQSVVDLIIDTLREPKNTAGIEGLLKRLIPEVQTVLAEQA